MAVLAVVGAAFAPGLLAQEGYQAPVQDIRTIQPFSPNIVGTVPYDGPRTAEALYEYCATDFDCLSDHLGGLLLEVGSEQAFGVLENLTLLDRSIDQQGHPLAHWLGRVALESYGDAVTALRHCTFVLAAGCFHGVQQSYFDRLAAVEPYVIQSICPPGDVSWQYQCLHGLGHGLMLHTNYALNRSLGMCEVLRDPWQSTSCVSGAIHENLVGYLDSQATVQGGAGGHSHGGPDRGPPTYMLPIGNKTGDISYPCNALAPQYLQSCYFFQTSVVVQLYNMDFDLAAKMCREAPEQYRGHCWLSFGRDTSASTWQDPELGSRRCKIGDPGMERDNCVRGYIDDVINSRGFDATRAAEQCPRMDEDLQRVCFNEIGAYSVRLGRAGAVVCDAVPVEFQKDCRAGAGLA